MDGWIQKSLITALAPDKEEAIRVWKCFRPSYIRAFNDAKDLAAAAVNECEGVIHDGVPGEIHSRPQTQQQ